MEIKLWAHDSGFGLTWIGTQVDQNLDMSSQGYTEIETVSINKSEGETYDMINAVKREDLVAKRERLMKELEEVEAQL